MKGSRVMMSCRDSTPYFSFVVVTEQIYCVRSKQLDGIDHSSSRD